MYIEIIRASDFSTNHFLDDVAKPRHQKNDSLTEES
jgi:hypothetical protein